ncbi:MAG: hypothetical protein E7643_02210 [Ruminococcaceae bacterium]|nr:hypothetical protein [Oscillospiraceae bacterium]
MMEEMNDKTTEIRFSDLLGVLKRCWLLMLVVAMVVGAGAYAFMHVTHKDEYTATATIWALGSNANTSNYLGSTSSADVQIAMYLINDYKELILTPSVMEKALKNADSDMSIAALKGKTEITNSEESHVMYVSVTAGSAAEARDVANELSKEFCRRVNERNATQGDSASGEEGSKERPLVSVWDEATAPKNISNPVSVLLVALLAILGAMVAYIVFLVLHLMDDKINTTADVERYLGLNLLGVIPNRDDARRRSMRKKTYYHYSNTTKAE